METTPTIYDQLTFESIEHGMNCRLYDQFLNMIPSFCALFTDRCVGFYATDMEKYIMKIEPGSKVPFITVGEPLIPESTTYKVAESRRPVIFEAPKELYGHAIRLAVYPLFDDNTNDVTGVIALVITRDKADALVDITTSFKTGLQEISDAIVQTASTAGTIMDNELELNGEIENISQFSNEITNISEIIKKIANETNMLGLNAAIEAARVGDQGRGFGVVAAEIRKLSDSSRQTAEEIRYLTQRITQNITTTVDRSRVNVQASQEQAAAAQEITASIQEMTAIAEQLARLAEVL